MKLKSGGLSRGAAWLEVYPRLMPVKMITKLKCEIESENKEKWECEQMWGLRGAQ